MGNKTKVVNNGTTNRHFEYQERIRQLNNTKRFLAIHLLLISFLALLTVLAAIIIAKMVADGIGFGSVGDGAWTILLINSLSLALGFLFSFGLLGAGVCMGWFAFQTKIYFKDLHIDREKARELYKKLWGNKKFYTDSIEEPKKP